MSTNLLSNTTSLQQILELLDKKAAGGGTNTEDATATAESILQGETAYIATGKVTGTMPNNGTIELTMDGVDHTFITIPQGYTDGGTVSLDDTISNEVNEQSDLITQLIDKANALPDINDTGETETEIINSIINRTVVEYGNSTLTSLSSSAFYSHPNLVRISFPNCTYIGTKAFCSCSKLQEISFPACKTIGGYAFASCSSLISANLPQCTAIYNYAFIYCSNLLTVSIPNCSYISAYAFYQCYKLQNVTMPNCSSTGSYAFGYCSSLLSVDLPICSSISYSAFIGCTNLTQLNAPSCSYIDYSAFYNCSGLSSLNIPLCNYIGQYAFYSCSTIPHVSLDAGKYIGGYAFAKCINLSSVVLGPNDTSSTRSLFIGSNAFAGCTSLTAITLLWQSVVALNDINAFQSTPIAESTYDAGLGSIYVLPSLVDRYKVAQNWSTYADRITAIIDE